MTESLIRIDEAAVAMRWSQVIRRRVYQVPGPNALWHIDGNHKLIRYETGFSWLCEKEALKWESCLNTISEISPFRTLVSAFWF